MKDDFNKEELDDVRKTISHCVEEMPGSNFQSPVTRHIQEVIKNRITITSESGRTAKLWTLYHKLVQLVKDFIRAETISDFGMHLSVVADMLPFFAAAGHSQYAKGARLYLELMMKQVAIDSTDIGRMFRKDNLHTLRYSTHAWSGIPTDLSIEQTLMRQAKSRGGLVGGKMRKEDTSHKLWISMLDHFTSVSRALDERRCCQAVLKTS